MYSHLHGTILGIEDGKVHLLATGTGLGFEIHTSPLTLAATSIGEEKKFLIHHHITEVSQTLFGFMTQEEKNVFRKLLKVNGVGGKTAVALLGLGLTSLIRAIDEGDEKLISTVPGIGKKIALKIILELKNQVSAEDLISTDEPQSRLMRSGNREITDALIGMGYDKRAVEKIVETIPENLSGLQEKMVYCIKGLN